MFFCRKKSLKASPISITFRGNCLLAIIAMFVSNRREAEIRETTTHRLRSILDGFHQAVISKKELPLERSKDLIWPLAFT